MQSIVRVQTKTLFISITPHLLKICLFIGSAKNESSGQDFIASPAIGNLLSVQPETMIPVFETCLKHARGMFSGSRVLGARLDHGSEAKPMGALEQFPSP